MLKVIFDTDPGVDDALALLYLHKHAQIDLIGVTTTLAMPRWSRPRTMRYI